MSDREKIVSRVTAALEGKPSPVVIRNVRKVDARGEQRGYWVVSNASGVIVASGTGEETFEYYCRTVGLDPADRNAVVDAEGRILTPGYVDIMLTVLGRKASMTVRKALMWHVPVTPCMAPHVRCSR